MPRKAKPRPAAAPARKPRQQKSQRRPLPTSRKPTSRKIDAATRRQAILDAALAVFAENGFGAARLDDVAAKAGVAKGTLYLYFKDKEQLFEAVIRNAASPLLDRLEALADGPALPFERALEALAQMFETEVLGTERKLVIRLVISEGPRFPRIAAFHYRHVVSRVMALISKLAAAAHARGELPSDAVARYPQLVAAPLITALIWDGLFAQIKPLDVPGFFRAQRQLLLATPRGGKS